MLPIKQDHLIIQGATWNPVMRWLAVDPTHKLITSVATGLPTLLTVVAHGLIGTARIPVWITNVKGPRGINTRDYLLSSPHWATVVDVDTLAIDFDSGSLCSYLSGGVLTYYAPVDLSAWSARQDILATPLSPVPVNSIDNAAAGGIVLGADGSIERVLTAEQTAGLAPLNGWHRLDLTDPAGVVTRFEEGAVNIAASAD